jgi:SM-20-related protein
MDRGSKSSSDAHERRGDAVMSGPEEHMLTQFEQLADAVFDRGYGILDDFLAPVTCENLLQELVELRNDGHLQRAGIGRGAGFQHNEAIRGDEIMWIEQGAAQTHAAQFLTQLEALIQYFNRSGFAGIRDYEAHFAAYPPGTFYKRHLDQFKDKGSRRFTFIFYLNKDWLQGDGGELRIYLHDEGMETSLDIAPIAGRLVCFRSEMFEHEVLPTQIMRYSITGWWLDRPKDLAFLK